ncbi:MAG: hypothetical protein IIU62_08450, partial [Alistipes sp.]|nr:hypothetical protein [Alistipes sp.]
MKRIIALLLLVMCSLNSSFAQTHRVDVKKFKDSYDHDIVELSYHPSTYNFTCKWDSATVPCTFFIRHHMGFDNQPSPNFTFYLWLQDSDLSKYVKGVYKVEILLSNNEVFIFGTDEISWLSQSMDVYNDDELNIVLMPYGANAREYISSYRDDDEIDSEAGASTYFYNQLSLYDIKAILLNGSQLFVPQFKSSDYIKSLVGGMRLKGPIQKGLPDVNNLDRSWTRKRVGSQVIDLKDGGYIAEWNEPLVISKGDDEEIDFWFAIEKNATDEVPRLLFLCDGYEKPKRESSYLSISITLSNGAKYQVLVAQMDVDYAYDVSMSAKLSSFYQNDKLHPKTLLQQLAKYDIVEVTMAQNKYDLRNADASSADAFTRMCKTLLEKTGAADLYALNTPAAAARPTATPKPAAKPAQPAVRPTQPTPKPTPKPAPQPTKSEAERIAEADRRAVELMTQGQTQQTQKPTQPSTGESGGFLLKAQGKLKYSRHISRKDHIAPREMVHTPLALFTSRAIPLDVVVELVDGAKGVGKVQSSTSSDGKQQSVSVRPSEFHCRVSGFEEVPCTLMSVGYDAANTEQIKTSSFTYNLPSSWKRSKVKEYAKAFAEDLARLGGNISHTLRIWVKDIQMYGYFSNKISAGLMHNRGLINYKP